MIKTINLTGSEVKVTELGGDNTEIFNNSGDNVYASKLPNITFGGDEVIAIPAGAIDGLYGTRGTVYLLGTGSVELRGVDHKITKARGQSVSNGVSAVVLQSYVDDKCSETLENAKEYADSLNTELAGYIGYIDNDIYGLEADFENCIFRRLAGAVGKTAGADFDSVNAYGGRRRCNLSDDGEVLAYYGDDNFKADGSNGQVMVEQPKFYYKVVPLKTEKIDGADGYYLRKAHYYISDTPKAGFKVHPAFVRNGIETDKIYLSAFEGCIYDISAQAYLLEDEQVADFDNDKLSSIAGAKPCSGLTQSLTKENASKLANNRGAGWEQMMIQSISATQLLFIIEYASFNSQDIIGMGSVSKTNTLPGNCGEKTGCSLPLGNKSGNAVNSNNIQSVTYRGEENLWGNIWKFMDGINVVNPETFEQEQHGCLLIYDDKAGAYKNTGLCTTYGSDYIHSFGYSQIYDWLFVPAEYGGNNTLPIGDRAWSSLSGHHIPEFGGMWHYGTMAGIFTISFDALTTTRARNVGSRLTYFPC